MKAVRVRRWHRWSGYVVAAPLLFISITGVLLNHADELALNERHASSRWILNRYGMGLSGEPSSFSAGDSDGRYVTSWGGMLFLDAQALEVTGELVGVLAMEDDSFAIVCAHAIHLVDSDGQLLESLGDEALPEGEVEAVWNTPAIQTEDGRLWWFTEDFLEFEKVESARDSAITISKVSTPKFLREKIASEYRGQGLPWSRILLDLHSGRFFWQLGEMACRRVRRPVDRFVDHWTAARPAQT